jgi:hypothetical protein
MTDSPPPAPASPPGDPGFLSPAARAAWEAQRAAVARLAREHPALLLTGAYLALTVVGLVYEFWFYMYFRIVIVEFAETSDFLLAAVRTPFVILLSLLPVPLAWALFHANQWLMRLLPRYAQLTRRTYGSAIDRPAMYRWVWAFFIIIYAVLFAQRYAERQANRIKAGRGRPVEVRVTSSDPAELARWAAGDTTLLIGTTSRFVFLYHPATRRTDIVPVEQIERLTVDSRRRREREADARRAAGDTVPR